MLTLDLIRQRSAEGETFEYLFFWGYQPSKTGKVTNSCFSQWFDSGFTIDGVFYQTAEHWGIGLKAGDERAMQPDTWQGQNLLGFALMDMRPSL